MDAILNWMGSHPLVVIIILVVLFIIFTYNSLNSKKNRVEKSFSTIDVYLEKRFDEVSELLEQTMSAYDHESETYVGLAKARSGIIDAKNGSINDKINAANNMQAILANPLIRTEAYPELKAIQEIGMFTAKKTSENESQLASARKQYNSNATSYNTKIKSFPTVLLASMFGFNKPYELFKATEAKRLAPNESVRMARSEMALEKANSDAEIQRINQEAALLEAKANLAMKQQAYNNAVNTQPENIVNNNVNPSSEASDVVNNESTNNNG